MNAPRFDWADFVALECLSGVHTLTVAEATTVIADALRKARAKGHDEGLARATNGPELIDGSKPRLTLTEELASRAPGPGDPAMMEFARQLGRSAVKSPRELRERPRNMQQHRVGD